VPFPFLPGWLRAIAPASPGYWALVAYRGALTGRTSQLGQPLVMLGVYAFIGVGLAALIGARQSGRLRLGAPVRAVRASA
jgi:ABC-2 type transport system permease protein